NNDVGRKSRGGVDLPIYRCARGSVLGEFPSPDEHVHPSSSESSAPGPSRPAKKRRKRKEKLCSPAGYKPATSLQRSIYDRQIDSTDADFQRKGENC
ncbi:hypothetical protein ElyMa_005529200, partial [Elysia marginata]